MEEAVLVDKIVKKLHLKRGTYNLNELCDALTDLCIHAKFEVLENKSKNPFEGSVKISLKEPNDKFKSVKYTISNKLSYKLGIITSWTNLFAKGLENNTEFYMKKNSQEINLEQIEATLISHLSTLTISANFLKNQTAICYFTFSKEQILQILEDKLSICQISQHDQNIISLPFYGMFIYALT